MGFGLFELNAGHYFPLVDKAENPSGSGSRSRTNQTILLHTVLLDFSGLGPFELAGQCDLKSATKIALSSPKSAIVWR